MKLKLLLVGILLLASFFRFYNTNWDQGNHLHPDERFLTMVGISMKLPSSFTDYLTPGTSLFNPANIGYKFYVYGTFPLTLNKLLALQLDSDNYADFTQLGRVLSGFFDLLIVVLIFKTISRLEKRYKLSSQIKFWCAFFYAIAVLPIQLSHFFAVDTFLNFFLFLTFALLVQYSISKKIKFLLISGIIFGFALASKVSAIYALPLFVSIIFIFQYSQKKENQTHHTKAHFKRELIKDFLLSLVIFFLPILVVTHLADPYYFQNADILDPRINTNFQQNISILKSWENIGFPPSVQWVNKTPILFSLFNLSVFGLGLPFFFFSIYGAYILAKKRVPVVLLIALIWTLGYFLYQSTQFIKTMRYIIILFPYLAIFAGFGFYEFTKDSSKHIKALLILLIMIWPLLFFSIYTKDHSRTQASRWIYQNIPQGSTILTEHWDDSLPIAINPPSPKTYSIIQLPVFNPDTPEKWQIINPLLKQGDYLILSSNRGWGSMPTLPKIYPQTTKYYQNLFSGHTPYKKVAEFTSYPSLNYLGIPITVPDDIAEEAYSVYDHPKVIIFKNTAK